MNDPFTVVSIAIAISGATFTALWSVSAFFGNSLRDAFMKAGSLKQKILSITNTQQTDIRNKAKWRLWAVRGGCRLITIVIFLVVFMFSWFAFKCAFGTEGLLQCTPETKADICNGYIRILRFMRWFYLGAFVVVCVLTILVNSSYGRLEEAIKNLKAGGDQESWANEDSGQQPNEDQGSENPPLQ